MGNVTAFRNQKRSIEFILDWKWNVTFDEQKNTTRNTGSVQQRCSLFAAVIYVYEFRTVQLVFLTPNCFWLNEWLSGMSFASVVSTTSMQQWAQNTINIKSDWTNSVTGFFGNAIQLLWNDKIILWKKSKFFGSFIAVASSAQNSSTQPFDEEKSYGEKDDDKLFIRRSFLFTLRQIDVHDKLTIEVLLEILLHLQLTVSFFSPQRTAYEISVWIHKAINLFSYFDS